MRWEPLVVAACLGLLMWGTLASVVVVVLMLCGVIGGGSPG